MNQKPGLKQTGVELLNMMTNAVVVLAALCAGLAVIAGLMWAVYQLLVVMEALS